MTKIGIQISSVRAYLQTPPDVLASFRKVSEIGYRAIQIQWIAPEVPGEFIRAALAETRLKCLGTQDYYHVVIPQLDEVAALNDLWGSASICVSGIPERYRSLQGCLEFVGELNRLSEQLERQGKVLAFHPRNVDVIWWGGENSLDVIRERTRPEMQFCLDVYQYVRAGLDPVEWLHKLQGRVDLVHFKDGKPGPDGKDLLMPVGQGKIDWQPIFQACHDTGVKYGLVEQETWHKDAFECLKEGFEFCVKNGIEPD